MRPLCTALVDAALAVLKLLFSFVSISRSDARHHLHSGAPSDPRAAYLRRRSGLSKIRCDQALVVLLASP